MEKEEKLNKIIERLEEINTDLERIITLGEELGDLQKYINKLSNKTGSH